MIIIKEESRSWVLLDPVVSDSTQGLGFEKKREAASHNGLFLPSPSHAIFLLLRENKEIEPTHRKRKKKRNANYPTFREKKGRHYPLQR